MSKAYASNPIFTLTILATATVEQERFVTTAGAYPSAGGLPIGVTRSAGESGDVLPVDVLGTSIVTAGAAIAVDAAVMVSTNGKVITHDGDGDKHAVGRALTAASADGDTIEVLLIPSAGLLVTAV
jgi:hypothetical protein